MRNLILVFLVISSVMIFFSCQEESALAPELDQSDQVANSLAKPSPMANSLSKPLPNLIGTTDADFTLTPPTFWNGTVDFGEGRIYGLTFISGPDLPRDYSQASPYYEDFVIYELSTDWTIPANVYVKGWNAGVVTYANKAPDPVKVVANGKITEAYGPLKEWQGRNVHFSGLVSFNDPDDGFPKECRGTVRIN